MRIQNRWFTALIALLVVAAMQASPAFAQRRGREAAAKLTEETLVPTELFPEADAARFAYGDLGFDVIYSRLADRHTWKLTERSFNASPEATGVAPAALPDAADTLPPMPEEEVFLRDVALLRPTFVTLRFAESAQAATDEVEMFFNEKSDESQRPANLAVFTLERDAKLAPGAVLYGREFNLGPKTGGVRRGFAILLAKGSVLLKIETFWGLRDGIAEADLETLEKRARTVAAYLLKKI